LCQQRVKICGFSLVRGLPVIAFNFRQPDDGNGSAIDTSKTEMAAQPAEIGIPWARKLGHNCRKTGRENQESSILDLVFM